jgi:hypothetical protein
MMGNHSAIQELLREMGLDPATLSRTLLIRGGHFVGIKFLFDGGYAVQLAGKNSVEVYDDVGKLLKTVAMEESDKKGAA